MFSMFYTSILKHVTNRHILEGGECEHGLENRVK